MIGNSMNELDLITERTTLLVVDDMPENLTLIYGICPGCAKKLYPEYYLGDGITPKKE
jgi:hypothetical protein